MRDDYAAVVQMTEQLLKAAREAANLVVGMATDTEYGTPVYAWVQDTYQYLTEMLQELAQARKDEP